MNEIYGTKRLQEAMFFRSIAFEIDQEPDNIQKYSHAEIITECLSDQTSDCITRVKLFESLAYGDAGVLLACPGPSLSGLMLRELGNKEQKEYFYHYLHKNRCRTFLAVTEPEYGSNAANMQTKIHKNLATQKYYISGHKWLVGNGAVGDLGVVLVRMFPGPLGLVAVLLTPEELHHSAANIYRTKLPMTGLRGAQLSYFKFSDLMVEQDRILGWDLNATQRGLLALIKTFNRMRPCVAALALGLSQAVLDYIAEHDASLTCEHKCIYKNLMTETDLTRRMLYRSAKKVDDNPLVSSDVSFAKLQATRLATKITAKAIQLFGQASLLEHPWLLKWYRDAYGFEYMEGTEAMQKKHIYQGWVSQQ